MADGDLRDSLDHPVFFLIVVTVGVFCLAKIFAWGLKAANLPGPGNIFD